MSDDLEYLIAYSNLTNNLFSNQKHFCDRKLLNKFYKDISLGFPICLPANIKYFNYNKAKFYRIDKSEFAKKIFNTKNLNYIGVKKFFRYGDIFAHNVSIKFKYRDKLVKYHNNFIKLKKKILTIRKNNQKICAMQIRNVPHFGHEAIFKHILSRFDFLFLNPIFGIKKKNDFNNRQISIALNYIKKKYKRIFFMPIWTNFHYAGPREAFHHMHIRQNLGFSHFYVGRDHAGAESLYKVNAAANNVKKYKKNFIIKPFISAGGYYCSKCKNYVIKNQCRHKNLKNISGTEFRQYIRNKKIYVHADKKIQKLLFK